MLFEIQDTDKNALIVNTHYYKWLLSNEITNVHNVHTKIEYLQEQGFILGESKLSFNDLDTLKHIEQHYFYTEIRPNLERIQIAQ